MTSQIQTNLQVVMRSSKSYVTNDPTALAPSIACDLQFDSQQLTNSTDVDASEVWSGIVTLSAGAATIDLTSLTQTGLSPAINMTGLKLRAIAFQPHADNTHNIQIGTGASNGYAQIGVIGPLTPGSFGLLYLPGTSAVDGTHKTLDVAGTGTEKLRLHLVFGAN